MPKRLSKISESLKQLGEIQVTEWDFMSLLNKDMNDLEIPRSLKRLGNIQVMEWDFRTVVPAAKRLAYQEVDLVDLVKRAAAYKVMEWDFKKALPAAASVKTDPTPAEVMALSARLRDFVQYVAMKLIDEPGRAHVEVQEIAPGVLRFKLVLVKKDVAMLIGREGHTAAAIRNVLQATAKLNGVHALLQIHSHEQEMAMPSKETM